MKRFPDQSQINRFLKRMGPEEISQLCLIFEGVLKKVALFQDEEKVDLNIDTTGLVVYGKKGYFPKRRGKKGYQLSLGTTNCQYSQILSLILDPGNISLAMRLWDTIYQVEVAISFRKRTDIESIIRDDKYGLHIDNLRSKNFSRFLGLSLHRLCYS